jgi:AcrR family transcriptional regulator
MAGETGTAGTARTARAGTPAKGRALRARGQATLARLLEAGADVFAAKGFHAARVDDVVKAAETSHGTFYLYFANKEELFQALAGEAAEELGALAGSLGELSPDAAGEAALRTWIDAFADLFERYGAVLQAWIEAETDEMSVGILGTDVMGRLAASVAERIEASSAPGIEPAVAALAIVAMVERFLYLRASGQHRVSRAAAVDTLTTVTQAALFGPT